MILTVTASLSYWSEELLSRSELTWHLLHSMRYCKDDQIFWLSALSHKPERQGKSWAMFIPNCPTQMPKSPIICLGGYYTAVFLEGRTTSNYRLAVVFSGYLSFGHESINWHLAFGYGMAL